MTHRLFWPLLILAGGALLALIIATVPVHAEPQCAPVERVMQFLSAQHGESPVVIGLMPTAMMQVWANPDTGTWTLLRITPDGQACMMASGGNLEFAAPMPKGDPA